MIFKLLSIYKAMRVVQGLSRHPLRWVENRPFHTTAWRCESRFRILAGGTINNSAHCDSLICVKSGYFIRRRCIGCSRSHGTEACVYPLRV